MMVIIHIIAMQTRSHKIMVIINIMAMQTRSHKIVVIINIIAKPLHIRQWSSIIVKPGHTFLKVGEPTQTIDF